MGCTPRGDVAYSMQGFKLTRNGHGYVNSYGCFVVEDQGLSNGRITITIAEVDPGGKPVLTSNIAFTGVGESVLELVGQNLTWISDVVL